MNLSAPWIRRPVMTTLVMTGIMLFGMLGYRQLPVSDLPNVDYPVITVSASLPGASPETMASAVATPLEKQFSTIAGVEAMTSTSSLGATNITMQFSLDRSIDAAAQDVQAAISKTQRQLPQGILPPSYNKVNPADSPILYIALTADGLPLSRLDEYAQTFLAQRMSSVKGVAQVSVYGSQKYAVRIQLSPDALAARGIGIDQVTEAIGRWNVNLPAGVLWGRDKAQTLDADGQLRNAQEFRDLVVARPNGSAVRLGDLGRVVDDVQDNRAASWFNGTRAIMLAVQRQPGTNTVEVSDGVRALIDKLRPQLPASVHVNLLYDRAASIREGVTDVQLTLLLTLVLVVLVIYLFLGSVRATLIPSLALPLSLVGTFAAMKQLGYSIDNLSLMALTLSVGFVVDDAIVMLENIVRHQELGEDRRTASLSGSREIGFTILSMTVSLVAVFIPVFFMGGLLGRLFHEFAVTITVAILISGFVSLTLTPMLCSRFLRAEHSGKEPGRFQRATEAQFQRLLGAYSRSLTWVMRHRRGTMVFSALVLVAMVWMFRVAPKGFLPTDDNSQLMGTTETAEGTSFEAMAIHQKALADRLMGHPAIDGFMSSVGSGGPGGTVNQGRLFIHLKPRHERPPIDQVIRELAPKLATVPGIRAFLQNPPSVRIGARSSKSLYQFTLQGTDLGELYEGARALEAKLRQSPELADVTSDLQIRNPQVRVSIDRDRASALGVTAQQIQQALYDAYGSRQVSTIYTPENQYWVLMELMPQFQRDLTQLKRLMVRSQSGTLVPIGSVADLTEALGPMTVNHAGQIPAVTLSFNLAPGVALGEGVAAVEREARGALPASVNTNFAGNAQVFQDSQRGLLALLLVAVLVIYLVLGMLYESFIHPLTILSGLPFAGFGALLTLGLFRVELGVYAFVGIILLVGLVKKNAIMMIDFALEAERKHGKGAEEAILEACRVRFRPIMMTTMAALMGTLPIALGIGAGAESRRPLGLAVVGGLAFSQIVTLYVTPVLYTYFDRLQRRFGRHRVAVVSGGESGAAGAARPEGVVAKP